MKLKKLFYLLLILPFLFIYTGCSKDDNPSEPQQQQINEAEVLAQYLEANGDFVNTTAPAIISAQDVSHVKGINATGYEKIVIACYSGQTAGMAVTFLRLLGYNNVFSLKWGMSSWNSTACTSWSMNAVGNNYTNFTTTATAKPAAGNLPTISTGKTEGKAILEERINQLLASVSASAFDDIKITWGTVTGNLSNYFIVNYWPANQYNLGHLNGAVQYTPKTDLKLSTALKTLPTNKPVVIYCYTGQTSAQVATYLKLLGYDAKTLLFGVNAMNYDWMGSNGIPSQWVQTEVKEYPVVTGQ